MTRVERGNVVLRVQDYEVERYLSMGYNVTDENGTILKKSVPTQLGELQKAYVDHTALIESLKEQVAELTAQLEQAQAKPKKTTKSKAKEE